MSQIDAAKARNDVRLEALTQAAEEFERLPLHEQEQISRQFQEAEDHARWLVRHWQWNL